MENQTLTFADLQVGDRFLFATKKLEGQPPYVKEEEMRRPYQPESHSNASYFWRQFDPHTNDVVSLGRAFFYVSHSTPVILWPAR
jgi:hypothetical protein